jgi:hypothetical protein
LLSILDKSYAFVVIERKLEESKKNQK